MKCGDLVKLSAYGKRKLSCRWIMPDDVGLVIKVIDFSSLKAQSYYLVDWIHSDFDRPRVYGMNRKNIRKDLMHVKT